jgi:hypothetical protein
LLYIAAGDLVFVDYQPVCQRAAVFRLRDEVHVKAISSLRESRQAHEWSSLPGSLPEVLYQSPDVAQIGGLVYAPTFNSLCLSARIDGSVVLVMVPLTTDKGEEEEGLESGGLKQSTPSINFPQLINLTQHLPYVKEPGALAISQGGYVFVATEEGIVIVDPVLASLVGAIEMQSFPTSLTLGEDGFLYITTDGQLYRIAIKDKPIKTLITTVRRPPKVQ